MAGEEKQAHEVATSRPSLRPSHGATADAALASFEAAGGNLDVPQMREVVAAVGEHAPALLPLCLGDVTLLEDVLSRPLQRSDSDASIRARFLGATDGMRDGDAVRRILRRLRHRGVVRIAMREVMRFADVDQTASEMSSLASACTEAALRAAIRSAEDRFGLPIDAAGAIVPIVVLGMGKLGGQELNLGSDIDVCFFYGTDDATIPGSELTVNELYSKVAVRCARILADVTEDGFCFRVDLRLRPEGSRGAMVNSLAGAERYYESFGRTWERAALLRARPIAGDLAFGAELLAALRPFVYRRQVDPGIAKEMAALVERSRRELSSDLERDIKLGVGGIREAEFFVQALQLIWGGQYPDLQDPSTTHALRKLRAAGLVGHQEAMLLGADWALLRRVEHRIHMWASYQTHQLPPLGPQRDGFGRSLGLADGAELTRSLDAARRRVAALFRSLSDETDEATDPAIPRLLDLVAALTTTSDELTAAVERALPVADPVAAATHLRRLAKGAIGPLSAAGRERTPSLGSLLLEEVKQAAHPDSALAFLADLFAHLGGEWSYDKLFAAQPMLARRLVGLFGASTTISAALVGHPETLDALLALPPGTPTDAEIDDVHGQPPLAADDSTDPEKFVAALRLAKRDLTVRIGFAYVSGDCGSDEFHARLTALADAQVRAALRYARREAEERYGRPESIGDEALPADLAVVGMGKYGGEELGFGSDLDLLFVYGAEGQTDGGASGAPMTHAEYFARIAQRALRLLSQPDSEGPGYETDTRLRPNGSQGALVVSLSSLVRYHLQKSAPWERQALVRARVIAGDAALAAGVREVTTRLAYETDPVPPEELARVRARMQHELAHERPDRFHAKLGYGALTDVEFIVQYLQMVHGADTRVRERNTRRALSALRASGHLGEADADALDDALRFFRRIEQSLKLLDEKRDASLIRGGPLAERVARRLRIRERDGLPSTEVLFHGWVRRATEVRAIFERLIANVDAPPPWPADLVEA
jgi:[glutamine synthetase] adenylyltransferase / [glutamine synthetase]-adenylyl-L-tyrosine phosphorylase